MNRLLVTTVCGLLAISAFECVRADNAADNSREQYELMKLFVESFQQIESNYVDEVDRRELIEAAIQGMIRHLDQYSTYIPPAGKERFNEAVDQEFGGIGVQLSPRQDRLEVANPLPGSPAMKAGLRAGDVILAVDGTSLEDVPNRKAIEMIRGPYGKPVLLKIQHAGEDEEPVDVSVSRGVIQAPTVRGIRLNADRQWDYLYSEEPKIGYVQLSNFSRHSADELRTVIQELTDSKIEGLVLDLRSNPGGLLDVAIEICDMFLKEGRIVSVKGRNVEDQFWDASAEETFPLIPMAILVNRYSASASEVVSAALQDNERAVIVGERTWGKGSVQNVIGLEGGGSQLKLTMASYHRPSGVNIHRSKGASEEEEWGVRPDEGYERRFSGEQFRNWMVQMQVTPRTDTASESDPPFEDTQLGAAIEYLRQHIEKAE